ncbi:SIMPL domain-containing protein [Streptomyces sp. NPDC091385]|uniref:SIMPL domain-containing protein n=1 Tax=Streptomyces sp. NPDC091385 TaxID=3365997 RepID=UPI00381DCDBE
MTTPPAPAHGTPDAPLLVVQGEAEFETGPEIARIGITVAARGRDRRTTLDDLTRRNAAVLDLVKSYGEALAELSTGVFSITPELSERGRGERVRSHQGQVRLDAEFTDFTALAELTTRLADLELTRVDGPWWSLRPGSPVHTEARRRAVADALTRAREYADALGTTLAALVELADTGADRPRTTAAYGRAARSLTRGGPAEPPEPLDLEPARLTVAAQVTARFTLVPPRM